MRLRMRDTRLPASYVVGAHDREVKARYVFIPVSFANIC